MPELPEVETIRIGLSELLPGKKVSSVWHDNPKSFPNARPDVKRFLLDATFTNVSRRAKILLLALDSQYGLIVHLKMTGQLVYVSGSGRFGGGHPSDSLVGDLPNKTTRVVFEFSDGSQLFFNDQRKFGWIKLLPVSEIPNLDFLKKLGPEPLAAGFTPRRFRERFARRGNATIKAALLDQTVVAGVGNIYADEALWGAKIHPATAVKNVSKFKLNKLFYALQAVLKLSLEKGGSTDKNYVDAAGKKGSYLSFANVFRREGQPCRRCAATIEKTRVAGRGTHFCPKCQARSPS